MTQRRQVFLGYIQDFGKKRECDKFSRKKYYKEAGCYEQDARGGDSGGKWVGWVVRWGG